MGAAFLISYREGLEAALNQTCVLLLIFAAGLLTHGAHEFQVAALPPTTNARLWDMIKILNESSFVGEFLS